MQESSISFIEVESIDAHGSSASFRAHNGGLAVEVAILEGGTRTAQIMLLGQSQVASLHTFITRYLER